MHSACRRGQEDLIEFKLSMGKKVDLGDCECGMVGDARRTGLSISENDDLLGFLHTTICKL